MVLGGIIALCARAVTGVLQCFAMCYTDAVKSTSSLEMPCIEHTDLPQEGAEEH
jgi:hypothetical protein